MISNLNELKARVNIVDVMPLRKFGSLYKCPYPLIRILLRFYLPKFSTLKP